MAKVVYEIAGMKWNILLPLPNTEWYFWFFYILFLIFLPDV